MITLHLYVMGCPIHIIFPSTGFYLNHCEMIKKKERICSSYNIRHKIRQVDRFLYK